MDNMKKELSDFFSMAHDLNCITKAYGGEFVTANSDKWQGLFMRTTPAGEVMEKPLIKWSVKK